MVLVGLLVLIMMIVVCGFCSELVKFWYVCVGMNLVLGCLLRSFWVFL